MYQARELNNEGVRLAEAGLWEQARSKFRVALSSKLGHAVDHRLIQAIPNFDVRPVTPDISVSAGEEFVSEMRTQGSAESESGSKNTLPQETPQTAVNTDGERTTHEHRQFFDRPFHINPADIENPTLLSTINLVNLAMSIQAMEQSSFKVKIVYEIALVLVAVQQNQPPALLQYAILNNLGIWSLENNEDENAAVYFQVARDCFLRQMQGG